VADVGTGSGILAIAAARLGASRAHATDIDPLPRAVARQNVAANGVESIVSVQEMEEFDSAARDCDLVVANILAGTVIELTPSIRSRLRPGGTFVSSGIIDERAEEVRRALLENGFEVLEVREEDIWRCIVARRAG
jgi:ribosomal protein L11 methyltransferase